VEKAFQASVLAPQFRLQFDVASLTKADSETLFGALLKGRQGGWLSPNDAREETGWPRSDDPSADSLEPPVSGGRAADGGAGALLSPAPPSSTEGDKIAHLDQRRAAHGGPS
jgi:hypothetical protein